LSQQWELWLPALGLLVSAEQHTHINVNAKHGILNLCKVVGQLSLQLPITA
jgi:hypothetical protein